MDDGSWSIDRAVSLSEVWALVAAFNGLVGAWRLLGVCRAARAGAKEFLGSLPRLVVCGGYLTGGGGAVSEVWGLDLTTMRWKPMPALLCARRGHACCAVRGALVVLDDWAPGAGVLLGLVPTSRVEMLPKGAQAFVELPPLSCGAIYGAAAIAVDESDSAAGQVLLLGGWNQYGMSTSSVRLVDLATGICTRQDDLLDTRSDFAAARFPDRGIICAGGDGGSTAEMWQRPVQGALDAAWTGRELPAMSVGRDGCSGCMLSDGRFAVLGGNNYNSACTSSCEALTLGDDGHWSPLPPMHDTRGNFACAAVAGCIIVAGGYPRRKSAEVYDEVLGRWLRLPHDLPHDRGLHSMGSALL
jgi:hypothetical protein